MDSRRDDPDERYVERREEQLTPAEARPVSLGRPLLIVILAGLIVAMLIWIPADWWGSSVAPTSQPAVEQTAPPETSPDTGTAPAPQAQPETMPPASAPATPTPAPGTPELAPPTPAPASPAP